MTNSTNIYPPKISFITPHRNYSDLIRYLYKSLIGFLEFGCQWVIVDDFSSPEEYQKVENSLLDSPHRSQVLIRRLYRHKGAPFCRNLGATLAMGDYLNFVDADDFFKINDIVGFLKRLTGENIYFIENGFNYSHCESGTQSSYGRICEDDINRNPLKFFINTPFVHHSCLFYPRSLNSKLFSWNEDLLANQDGMFLWQICLTLPKFVSLQEFGFFITFRRNDSRRITCKSTKAKFSSRMDSILCLKFLILKNRFLNYDFGLKCLLIKRVLRDWKMYRWDLIGSSFAALKVILSILLY